MTKISVFQVGDEHDLSNLIKRVFDEFVAPDYSEAGNNFFHDFIVPENFIDRVYSKDNIILIAERNNLKVGMIEIRDYNHISLLFVDKEFQGEGIARELFTEALKICKLKDKSIVKIYVHASPFSIPVYQKLGFQKTGDMQEQFGIKYLPIERVVD